MKTAVLLINLGTPSALDLKSMKSYLGEFLMDGRVLDIPKILRWLLVNLIIVPFRSPKNLVNYGKIWTKRGSPLKFYAEDLRDGLRKEFGGGVAVEIAMRYQLPSIDGQLSKLLKKGVERVIVVPLYPQYASATTGSVSEAVFRSLSKKWHVPAVEILPPFFSEPLYVEAVANVARKALAGEYDHYVFSYHGLPVRHLQIGENGGNHCKGGGSCCERITEANSYCYRAHCLATTRLISERLGLPEGKAITCFQSRFGNDPWIQPYASETIASLAKDRGAKKIAVFCPAFVADCIETLEEIGLGEKENFLENGGEEFTLVPCLNGSEIWIRNLAQILKNRYPI